MRSIPLVSGILWALGTVTAAYAEQASPPRELTAEQDHKLMMDQLGITSIPGRRERPRPKRAECG
jgi:hypothetical protein